jgi:hypothetical protein
MRSDGQEGPMLTHAVDFCRERGIEFWGVNVNPEQAEWTSSPKVYAHHYIGDDALGCPLQDSRDMGKRPMADWSVIGPMVMAMLDAEKKSGEVSLSAGNTSADDACASAWSAR